MAHVLIVGAGPAGATLAYLLARRGVAVTLLERQTDFARAFRGEGLQPSGIDAFAQMGLAEAFEALPHCLFDAIQFHRDTQPLFRLDLAGGGPRWVSQPAMLSMLVEKCAAFESFTFVPGARVQDLVERERRVVGVRYALGEEEHALLGDYVVATDGRDSTVRKQVGLDFTEIHQSFDVVWCKVPPLEPIRGLGTMRVFLGGTHFTLVFPSYDDRLQIGWIIRKGSFGDLYRRGMAEWINEMADHVTPELGAHLRRQVEHISQPFLLNVICGHLGQWSRPGLLLLGDAAHPMSPVGGQGINLALRDALVAANHLVPALSHQPAAAALDMAATRILEERLPEITRIQRMQQLPARLLFAGGWRAGMVLRAARPLVGIGLAQILLAPVARRMAGGVTTVRLKV